MLSNQAAHVFLFTAYKAKHFPVKITMIMLKSGDHHAGMMVQKKENIEDVLTVMQEEKAFLATNGGFYRENFRPNGLLIIKGIRRSYFVKNKLLSAIVNIDKGGRLSLLAADQYNGFLQKQLYNAFQTGPILIDDGNIELNLNDYHVAKRVIYALNGDSNLLIFAIDSTTLEDSADIIETIAKYLHQTIKMAVNFDGGKAAGFATSAFDNPVVFAEMVPVKTVVYFFEDSDTALAWQSR